MAHVGFPVLSSVQTKSCLCNKQKAHCTKQSGICCFDELLKHQRDISKYCASVDDWGEKMIRWGSGSVVLTVKMINAMFEVARDGAITFCRISIRSWYSAFKTSLQSTNSQSRVTWKSSYVRISMKLAEKDVNALYRRTLTLERIGKNVSCYTNIFERSWI